MGIPDVKIKTRDGALQLLSPIGDQVMVKMGASSAGVVKQLYAFTDLQTVKDTLGVGPLPESIADALRAGASPVYGIRLNASVAGVAAAVVPGAGNTGLGSLTKAGAPLDAFRIVVEIIKGEDKIADAVGSFKYSLDNGNTWSKEIAIPAGGVYAIPSTGVTVTFVNAGGLVNSFKAADTFAIACTAPYYVANDLSDSLASLLLEQLAWSLVHIIGQAANGAGSAAMVAAVETIMETAESDDAIYARAIMEMADDTDANLKAAFVAVVAPRVIACAGFADVASALSARIDKRSSGTAIASRLASTAVHVHPGEVDLGALTQVQALYRDERKTPALDDAHFCTLRTIRGRRGFFITRGWTLADPTSDFRTVMNARVIDKACTIAHDRALAYLNKDLRVDVNSGQLDARDANAIEADLARQLSNNMTSKGECSGAALVLDRTHDILSDSTLVGEVRVVPKGYAETISLTVGFTDPAIAALAT
jgi:hypothetical protein